MTIEEELTRKLHNLYEKIKIEAKYPARRFLGTLKRNGGLKAAKGLLRRRNTGQEQKGFQKLMDVGRPDLLFENIVLQEKFRGLFTEQELEEAQRRVNSIPNYAWRRDVPLEDNYPEQIDDTLFPEGSKKTITIDIHERNQAARAECLSKHGTKCLICGMSFMKMYGKIGEGYIHVHHINPLAGIRKEYIVDPKKDLVPVCPNCHAMLHTCNPPRSVDELKRIISEHKGSC